MLQQHWWRTVNTSYNYHELSQHGGSSDIFNSQSLPVDQYNYHISNHPSLEASRSSHRAIKASNIYLISFCSVYRLYSFSAFCVPDCLRGGGGGGGGQGYNFGNFDFEIRVEGEGHDTFQLF